MYNRVRALCFIFSLTFFCSAADIGVSMGVKGGLNVSTWRGAEKATYTAYGNQETADPYQYRTIKPGGYGGVFVEVSFLKWLALQPEVFFTAKGIRFKDETSSYGHTAKYVEVTSVRYIEIPLLLKLMVEGFEATAAFYAGPALAFRVGAGGYARLTVDGEKDTETYPQDVITAMDEMHAKTDFGITGGTMFQFGKGTTKFVLDLRYTHGLLNVYENNDAAIELARKSGDTETANALQTIGVPAHKNMNFSAGIGIIISMKMPEWQKEKFYGY